MSNFIHVNVLVSFMSFFMLGSSECLAIEARNSKTNHPYLDMIEMQRNVYPQEKIHVVTDRDIYCGGDTVWFRIFVVDAATHQQTSMSKYAYVELLNPFGKVQERVKIIERNGIYSGYLPIYSDIYEGDYTLAAYTSFAENQGQEYFFKKPLKLISPNGDDFVIETNFISKGDTMVEGIFKVSKCDAENISKSKISYTMPDGEYVERPINKDFKRDFNLNKGENAVLATCGDHGKFLTIDYPENAYIKLAFYPEGGWLIAGDPCKVAFKATDSYGKGIEASGVIYEKDGERITEFNTSHNGMGSVSFVPEPGKTYIAEYMGPDLNKHTVEIGEPKEGAAALRFTATGSKCNFSIAGGNAKPYELVVACRGMGLLSLPITSDTSFSIDRTELPTGLYQAFLVSPTDSAVVSERLFFIGAERLALAENAAALSPDSTTIKLTAAIDNPVDCCVRILGEKTSSEDNSLDIFTQMLLQSELRGRIENPSYYFDSPTRETEQNLDLLMMVNGWSRYHLPDAIYGKLQEPSIPLEIGQEITGQVRSLWRNKPLEGIMVNAIAPKKNFGTFADTDADGIFRLNGFDFPENTPFIFKAMNEKGDNELNYEVFADRFPAVDKLHETVSVKQDAISYLSSVNKWKLLDAVNVTARSKSGADIYGFDTYGSLAAYSGNSNDFKAKGITSIEEAMRMFPGITTMMGNLKWRNRYVAYYLDGRLFQPAPNVSSGFGKGPTISELNALIPFEDIERIDFIRPENASVLGRTYGGGAVMIITKQGDKTGWHKQVGLKDFMPLGYQQYKEYASPMLSVDFPEHELKSQPTLLWLPSVKFDEDGREINLRFPVNSDYRIIIEGVAENGDIISETL